MMKNFKSFMSGLSESVLSEKKGVKDVVLTKDKSIAKLDDKLKDAIDATYDLWQKLGLEHLDKAAKKVAKDYGVKSNDIIDALEKSVLGEATAVPTDVNDYMKQMSDNGFQVTVMAGNDPEKDADETTKKFKSTEFKKAHDFYLLNLKKYKNRYFVQLVNSETGEVIRSNYDSAKDKKPSQKTVWNNNHASYALKNKLIPELYTLERSIISERFIENFINWVNFEGKNLNEQTSLTDLKIMIKQYFQETLDKRDADELIGDLTSVELKECHWRLFEKDPLVMFEEIDLHEASADNNVLDILNSGPKTEKDLHDVMMDRNAFGRSRTPSNDRLLAILKSLEKKGKIQKNNKKEWSITTTGRDHVRNPVLWEQFKQNFDPIMTECKKNNTENLYGPLKKLRSELSEENQSKFDTLLRTKFDRLIAFAKEEKDEA